MIGDEVTFLHSVRIGDIIQSPEFENLIYRDIMDQEPFCGFYVNPLKTSTNCFNIRVAVLETAGRMKRSSAGPGAANKYINLKYTADHKREFVVIYTQRNTDYVKEHLTANDAAGEFPLQVIAKMLTPDGEYDENGIEITFHMESELAKHCVPEVIHAGYMQFTRKRIF
jgi:hypothetical protein